ncbi:ribosomal-protein-alanine N-acetyltransferase [Betaproteobacteria bacterium SCN2]|jgi:ribosomal-protein-alanine N-acetyltransferase|nr:ribosomal-protein-alanine N-acetyltransferase [Betaproteobacteria bacterium SCN2]
MSAVLKLVHNIRTMRDADIPAVLLVEKDSYEFPWSAGNFIDSIHAGYHAWVYEVGGEIIGHAVLTRVLDEAHLLNITIAPGWRRQGLGRVLLGHAMDFARQQLVRTLYLEVRPSNRPAIELYEKTGFEAFALRKGYYPAREGREDALVMRTML